MLEFWRVLGLQCYYIHISTSNKKKHLLVNEKKRCRDG